MNECGICFTALAFGIRHTDPFEIERELSAHLLRFVVFVWRCIAAYIRVRMSNIENGTKFGNGFCEFLSSFARKTIAKNYRIRRTKSHSATVGVLCLDVSVRLCKCVIINII